MDLWDDCRRGRFDDEDIDLIRKQEQLQREKQSRLELLYEDELRTMYYANEKDLYGDNY